MGKKHMRAKKISDRRRRVIYATRKAAWLLAIAAVVAILTVADAMGLFGIAPPPDREKYHDKTFLVVNTVDGDTIDVDIPDGKWPHTRIRLWGVDTPETVHPNKSVQHFGPEASELTKKLCKGKMVRLEMEPGKSPRGTEGRLLAWVYLPDGRLLNRVLVAEGYGYADPRFDHHLKNEFRRLQNRARKAGAGLWKDVRKNDLPEYYHGKLKLPQH